MLPLDEGSQVDLANEFVSANPDPTYAARFEQAKATALQSLLELDPDLLMSTQLDMLLDHLIVKMVGNNPEAIEAAPRFSRRPAADGDADKTSEGSQGTPAEACGQARVVGQLGR